MDTSRLDSLVELAREEFANLASGAAPVVYLGAGSCGKAAGADAVKEAVLATLEEHKLRAHVLEVGCVGPCYLEPLMDITAFGNPRVSYANVKAEQVPQILERYLVGRDPMPARAAGHFGEAGFAGIPRFFDLPMLKVQKRVVLRNCGFIDPERLDHYLATDGYQGLKKALGMSPNAVIEEITASQIRGRGGAGFPTGRKWRFCRDAKGDSKYMICNADEGDPGAFMNRSLIEGDPHAVLEGMLIAAYAIGASSGYVYIRAEYPLAIRRLHKAMAQMREAGLLGKDILGSRFSFELHIKEGAGAFVCGEETALIHSIEGKRGMPRVRPPFPATSGLHGKPTVINNVETLGTIPQIVRHGAGWYRQFGVPGSHGTKTFSIVGKARRTGMIEVPLGIKLRDLIFEIGGGAIKPFKGVQTGGPSGGCLSERYLDTPVEYESLAAVGSIMGSGGLVVMDEDTCMVDIARYFMSFCAAESCGKCTPCRIGTSQLHSILKRICEGHGVEADLATLERIGKTLKAASLCGLGQTAANPILSTLQNFREEFEEHVRYKHCRAGVCQSLFISPCQNACPLGMDVPGYISMVAAGRYDEAIRIGRETNPFLSVCGRVCDNPCMLKCRRTQIDEPVAIRTLKRFIGDYARDGSVVPRVWVSPEKRNQRVAVIGAGPSGLSCAYFLARLGYGVTVFERLPVAGGMLAVGIPAHRLPKDIVEAEVQLIRDLGVEIRTGTRVGQDVGVSELLRQGYQAVFAGVGMYEKASNVARRRRAEYRAAHVAVGMYGDRELGVPGEDATRVLRGVDFLANVSLGNKVDIGRKVAVVGGGYTAVDVARTAVRLGADEVTIVYPRTREEMPAFGEEITEAEEEGVRLILLAAPTRVLVNDQGEVTGLECTRIRLGAFDNLGSRATEPVENSQFTLPVDTVIPAVGQFADVRDLFHETHIDTNPDGTIAVDHDGRTNLPGIFAGGDVAMGASTVIKAIAAGERAAVAIDQYLSGEHRRSYPWRDRSPSPVPFDLGAEPVPGRMIRLAKGQDRISPDAAQKEAQRCLRCDYREEEVLA